MVLRPAMNSSEVAEVGELSETELSRTMLTVLDWHFCNFVYFFILFYFFLFTGFHSRLGFIFIGREKKIQPFLISVLCPKVSNWSVPNDDASQRAPRPSANVFCNIRKLRSYLFITCVYSQPSLLPLDPAVYAIYSVGFFFFPFKFLAG